MSDGGLPINMRKKITDINRFNHHLSLLRTLRICAITALIGLTALLTAGTMTAANKKGQKDADKFVLVIDAGHGGSDHGAVDNGQKEKEINLEVAKRFARLVEKNMKDVRVVMTRSDDRFLTLQQRADIANNEGGDLFVSIHTNSVDKSNKNRKTVSGTSVYALGLHKDNNNMEVARRENSVIELENDYQHSYSGFDPNKDESYIIFELAQKKDLQRSLRFAGEAQKQLVRIAGRRDRGVHQAGFWVLWATSMPAVLVELDFICNPDQANYLGSDRGRDQLAESLYEAFRTYLSTQKQNEVPVKQKSGKGIADKEEPAPSNEKVTREKGDESVALLAMTDRSAQAPRENAGRKVSGGNQTKRQEFAQRRRRSTASRQQSDSRNLQTEDIPLHKDNERLASRSSQQTDGQKKSDEQPVDKKLEKKLRKEREKQEKERQKREREEKKRQKKSHGKIQKLETVYKIQILASHDLLKENNPRFLGLKPISVFRENNFYKYTYGESKTKQEIETLLKQVKTKIPDAFIIETTRQAKK